MKKTKMAGRDQESEYYIALGYDIENGCDVRVLVRDAKVAKYVQPAYICGIPKKEGITVLPTVELPTNWEARWKAASSEYTSSHDTWIRVE